ncbi:MAG: sulfotransferase domain-containing protein [Rhizobiales bacterium]|nr:sulfotransferase domain-containing protein [Hyphomicrobiales bacterium]
MNFAGTRQNLAARIVFLWQRTRIVSYPNSGRTWLRVMLDELGVRPRFTHAQSRYILALPATAIAEGVENYRHRRVLMLIRNPKDTTCSNYHQVTKRGKKWQGDFKTFLRHPNYGFERILAFNLAWLDARQRFHRGFHVESYEGMCADTPMALRRIVDFLNVPGVGDAAIAAAAARNRFDRMKAREQSGELFAQHGNRFSAGQVDDPDSRKARRGRIGGHVEDMDGEDIAYCDELLRRYRYDEIVAAALQS